MLGVTVIGYDSHAPVRRSFKAQSELCPFFFGGWTGERGGGGNRD